MPDQDLVAVWKEHLGQEFAVRNPDAPTHTMVADPEVNHVPTMTGGVGLDEVKRFYKYQMVPANPSDMAIAGSAAQSERTPSLMRWSSNSLMTA